MKDNTNIPVNHQVLQWARESIAMTRNQASEKTGISAWRLAQLEEGEKPPTLDELSEFSKAYKRTIATLLLNNPPKEKPLPQDRRTVDSAELGILHVKTIMAVRKARALAQSYLELKLEFNIGVPRFRIYTTTKDQPKEVAALVRKELKLHELRGFVNLNHALDGYIEKIESLGVAVFQLSLTQDKLRGFSIVDEALPIIVIKRGGETPTAKIFTLFHELGHLILNQGGLCDMSEKTDMEIEKWCNSFAAGLRSLLENGLTTSQFYKEKHRVWNKPSFGRAKNPEGRDLAKESITERGRTYISLAFSAFDQNRIDIKDLSDFLGIKLAYIQKTRQLFSAY